MDDKKPSGAPLESWGAMPDRDTALQERDMVIIVRGELQGKIAILTKIDGEQGIVFTQGADHTLPLRDLGFVQRPRKVPKPETEQ